MKEHMGFCQARCSLARTLPGWQSGITSAIAMSVRSVVVEVVVVAKHHVVRVVAVVLREGALGAQEAEGGGHRGVLVLERELALLRVALDDGAHDATGRLALGGDDLAVGLDGAGAFVGDAADYLL